jgi:hypothetical protein
MDTNTRVVLMRGFRRLEDIGEILGSHYDEYEDVCLLGYCTM